MIDSICYSKTDQVTFKEIANAIYGSCGESNFIFYDVESISNLTGTCYYTLLTTINQIEKVLGNRIILRNDQELLDYLSYLNKKDLSLLDNVIKNNNPILSKLLKSFNKEEDLNYIIEKIKIYCRYEISDDMINKVRQIISNVFNSNNIYRSLVFKYNCDFKRLIKDSDIFKEMISNDFSNYISNKYNEDQFKESNKDLLSIIKTFVYDDFLQSDLLDIADNYKRSVVMLSDSDSTFCVAKCVFDNALNATIDMCVENKNELDSILTYKAIAFRLIMVISESMSDFFLTTLGSSKYQNSRENKWKLKSEFLYNKILLMTVKKTYFGSILSQEGIRLNPMKLDNKNTELVRSIYSPFTKSFMKEICDLLVMSDDKKPDIYKVVDIVQKYENKFNELSNIPEEISKFAVKSNFKVDKAYKNDPMGVYSYKAAVTFNCLYPEAKVYHGDKTALFPIKPMSCPSQFKEENEIVNWFIEAYGINDDLKKRISEFLLKKNKSDIEIKVYNALIKDRTIRYLSSNYYSVIPATMLDIIDKDTMYLSLVEDRIVRIFDALRFKTHTKSVNSKKKNQYTNILMV